MNVDTLELFNLTIIISIMFISAILFKTYNKKAFIYLAFVFFIHAIILILNLKAYLLTISIAMILIVIKSFKNQFKLKNISFIVIGLLSILNILSISMKIQDGLIIQIILNLFVSKLIIINCIKNKENEIKKEKMKLSSNKKQISEITNKILLSCDLQNQYKNEILELNKDIKNSIMDSKNSIFVLNKDKECIYINKAFKIMMNIDSDKNEIDIFNCINSKFLNSIDILDGIQNLNIEKNLKCYDGKIYKFECVKEVLNENRVIICVLSDITESTLIKNKLKESEERYKKLMDVLNDGVIIHNMNSIKYINNKAVSLFNLNKDQKNLSIEDLILSTDEIFKAKFINNINLVCMGKTEKISTKIETKDGKTIEFITTTILLNNIKMLLTIAIDITKMEDAITDIEQSEKTYKLLLQTLPEGVVIIDKNTNNHIYRNKAMMKILKNIGVENLNSIIKNYLNECNYGKFKKFYTNTNKIKEIDMAIIDRYEDNAFLVVVRTLDDKYKTQQMKEMLDEISNKCRFKAEFLANVANDIKRPINTIFETNKILYLNKEKYESDYIDNYTRLVKQNCYRLMRLLDNIQQIGHLENGTYKMDIKKYDLINLTTDIVEKTKRYTDEKGLSIYFKSDTNKKIMAIDKEKIEKILLNLLSNSIKFTPKGGNINIIITCKKDEVYITVADTGEGIPEDKLDIIFENFEQVDRTLSRGAEGSGIGLSLVKKLADVHNAEIAVNSKINKGSEFILILKESAEADKLLEKIDSGYDFSDNEKIDIEFSDIYFNYSY
ncbi:PAS domain-containing sensor histidine kinase [Romboutsia lituseburensis]|uniref:PAS domain-containing sensor histidine kinase n=1 Tax=Romboutsia lituseburensis TaxID=1537 RepID=UPI00215AC4E0|nr:PAS domain-containing sensor histidine kinase [Romboutsia lituseburensis]MCR8745208.1 PAS domain-containing sensor histidine kinase [Romboutsia lituseburensis]